MPSMKNLTLTLAGIALSAQLALVSSTAHALASDRNQPMNIEADAMRHDDNRQETVFTGNVVVTKGTIVLKGQKLTVLQKADGSQHGTLQAPEGRRAFFSQQRDTPAGAPEETIEGEAKTIEYDSGTDVVRLINQGELRRYRDKTLSDTIEGSLIVHNNTTGQFSVDGQSRQTGGANNASGSSNGGRVRATIGATGSSSAPSAPAAPVTLNPSNRIE